MPVLNTDSLACILDFFDHPTAFASFRLVCRLFRNCANEHRNYYWTALFEATANDAEIEFLRVLASVVEQSMRVHIKLRVRGQGTRSIDGRSAILCNILPAVARSLQFAMRIRMEFDCPDTASACLESFPFLAAHLPRLRGLEIACMDCGMGQTVCIPPSFLGSTAASLSFLYLDRVVLPECAIPLFAEVQSVHVVWYQDYGHFDFLRTFPKVRTMVIGTPDDEVGYYDPNEDWFIYRSLRAHRLGNLHVLTLDGPYSRRFNSGTRGLVTHNPGIRNLHVSVVRLDTPSFDFMCSALQGSLTLDIVRDFDLHRLVGNLVFTIKSATRAVHVRWIGILWRSAEDQDAAITSIVSRIALRVAIINIPLPRAETLATLFHNCCALPELRELSIDLDCWSPSSRMHSWVPSNILAAVDTPMRTFEGPRPSYPHLQRLRVCANDRRTVAHGDELAILSEYLAKASNIATKFVQQGVAPLFAVVKATYSTTLPSPVEAYAAFAVLLGGQLRVPFAKSAPSLAAVLGTAPKHASGFLRPQPAGTTAFSMELTSAQAAEHRSNLLHPTVNHHANVQMDNKLLAQMSFIRFISWTDRFEHLQMKVRCPTDKVRFLHPTLSIACEI
ncbi:hypothetical protein EXIGLDRAFT_761957 [Exidia glandulosa HHB12029]|uniref:F-box domain-containing protein n=1 Tax=Exidia glandulosa HHB12029 TaxID=1314781 RepID=A0A165N1W5_EXIGL|nr:hypothetical protein EXIGLDRAFT_761957 [Exidia glandulosa HHB12029]